MKPFDVRREIYKDGKLVGYVEYLVVKLSGPSKRSSPRTPCVDDNGDLWYDDPYRDGAHARWDSEELGGIPVYVIAPNGTAIRHTSEVKNG